MGSNLPGSGLPDHRSAAFLKQFGKPQRKLNRRPAEPSKGDREGVESRRRRILDPVRLGMWILLLEPWRRRGPSNPSLAVNGRFGDEFFEQAFNEFAVLCRAEIREARKRCELESRLNVVSLGGMGTGSILRSMVLRRRVFFAARIVARDWRSTRGR